MKKNGDGWTSSASIDSGFADTLSKKLVGKIQQILIFHFVLLVNATPSTSGGGCSVN
jgi:hypothetical protein